VRAFHEKVQFVKGALAMLDMLADDSDAKKHRDIILPSKTEKEISHQEKTPGITKEVVGINSFSQL
jgi:hypothetical protein